MIGSLHTAPYRKLLAGCPSGAVLFEPYIAREMVTRLIWRGGAGLWDTLPHRLATLTDVYTYLHAGTVTVDAVGADDGVYTVIADSHESLRRYAASTKVCALATHRLTEADFGKPVIWLAGGNDSPEAIREAVRCGMKGIYLSGRLPVEEALSVSDDAAVLGGLGVDFLNTSRPLTIYSRVQTLWKQSGGRWAIGSGSAGQSMEYLGFISMLGIYNKLKNEEY